NTLVKGVRLRDMSPEEEADVAGWLGGGVDSTALEQGLDLGGDPDRSAVIGIVKGLDAKRITGEKKSSVLFIPYGKRIHAPQALHHPRAVFGIEVQQNLGIARGSEAVPLCLQLSPQFTVIIDFTVEDDLEAAVRRRHGLRPGL